MSSTDLTFTVQEGEHVRTFSFDSSKNPLFSELWMLSNAPMLFKENKDVPFVNALKPLREMKCRSFFVYDCSRDEAVYVADAVVMQIEMLIAEYDRRVALLPPGDAKITLFRDSQAELRALLIGYDICAS